MKGIRITAVIILLLGALVGYGVHASNTAGNGWISNFPFKLGLDLNGGSHLVYKADVSKLPAGEVSGAMDSLKQVIESRINAFGVSEPIVQTETARTTDETIEKLVVELPGVTDVAQAIDLIGKTPVLEFKIEKPEAQAMMEKAEKEGKAQAINMAELFVDTQLTGRYLQTASVQFDPNTQQPEVLLIFNDEGKRLFSELTQANINKVVAIFLDGKIISAPVVRSAITDGRAVISGNFNPQEAKDLARDLRYGALPVPIELIGTQTIGASLGKGALDASVLAGIWGFIIVSIFLIFWYRVPGVVAVVSLALYVIINLALFKLIPVVLTSAGLAAFIISLGMAVDGNILIFERMKEEMKKGHSLEDSIREGFNRAWLSIRDSNLSSIITAIILYTFATSALIKGFALVFFIGVLVSMLTSITISRTLLIALSFKHMHPVTKFLFSNGIKK